MVLTLIVGTHVVTPVPTPVPTPVETSLGPLMAPRRVVVDDVHKGPHLFRNTARF